MLPKFPKRFISFGPESYSRRALIRQLEKHPNIRKALEDHKSKRHWFNRFSPIRRYLKEMVASPSPASMYVARYFFRFLWNRIFKGIEIRGVEDLQGQPTGRTFVYVPCHRSHLDYLLMSYILYMNGLPLPHIIAGNNLNLFLVGRFLKTGGAVFIRRIFKGKPLYSTTFLTYLYYLLDHGFPIEFFIEGGRSRTGKNLPPKTGVLSMLVQYLQERSEQDLFIVPVSIVYEKMMEEATYIKELGGIPKRRESLGSLLKAYKLINMNYGKVYVSFAKPLSLRQMIFSYKQQFDIPIMPTPRTPEYQAMVYGLGMEIMDFINVYTHTSAVPIIATALLSERRQGFRKQELIEKVQFLIEVYSELHPLTDQPLATPPQSLEQVIEFMFASGSVGCVSDQQGDIYFFQYQNKIRLNLYKNVLIHHFVLPSVVAFELQHGTQTQQSLLEHIAFFDHLFRYVFMFPRTYDFAAALDTILRFGLERKMILQTESGFKANSEKPVELNLLARILLPFREAFHVAIYSLKHTRDLPIESKALIRSMQDTAVKLLLLGEIETPEGNLSVTYQYILQFLTEENYVQESLRDGLRVIEPGQKFGSLSQLEESPALRSIRNKT